MQRVLIGLLVGILVWVGVVFPKGDARVVLLGDLAPDMFALLPNETRSSTNISPPAQARFVVVTVTDWDKLDFVPGARAICGETCRQSAGLGLVRVNRASLRGLQRYVFINIDRFLDEADTARFSLSETGAQCLSAGLAAEMSLRAPGPWPDPCIQPQEIAFSWRFALL